MTKFEKKWYATKAHMAGAVGLLAQFLVVLSAATVSLVPSATVFAQQAVQRSDTIRPFHVAQAALVDLRRRIAATKWPPVGLAAWMLDQPELFVGELRVAFKSLR